MKQAKNTDNMSDQEIDSLLDEMAIPCVSIILSTHRVAPERITDEKSLEKLVAVAKNQLKQKYVKNHFDIDSIVDRLDHEVNNIDYTHLKDGIGIYVSPAISQTVHFPFPVVEKVKVNASFDCRDLLYLKYSVVDYLVLSVSYEDMRLFHGKGEGLKEELNADFPKTYDETYEYAGSSRGNSFTSSTLKGFEQDKSQLKEERMVTFLRSGDKCLKAYLNSNYPLVIAGGEKPVADFLKITKHKKQIITTVNGSYIFNGDMPLAKCAWEKVQQYMATENNILMQKFAELIGEKLLAIGIEEVWQAATEGKGMVLMVEKVSMPK